MTDSVAESLRRDGRHGSSAPSPAQPMPCAMQCTRAGAPRRAAAQRQLYFAQAICHRPGISGGKETIAMRLIELVLAGLVAGGLTACASAPVTGRSQLMLVSESEAIN